MLTNHQHHCLFTIIFLLFLQNILMFRIQMYDVILSFCLFFVLLYHKIISVMLLWYTCKSKIYFLNANSQAT